MFRLLESAFDPYTSLMWWLFDSRETSGKTCPTCLALHSTHYRGDELDGAFPFRMQVAPNKFKAKVHPNCRCVLVWAGRTKQTYENPVGMLRKKPRKPELPQKVAGKTVSLSPSQHRLWKRTTNFARETLRLKK